MSKTQTRVWSILLIGMMLLTLLPTASLAADENNGAITILEKGNTTYSTLEDAVSAAEDGDTICIPAGTYYIHDNSLTIAKAINVQGAGMDKTILVGNLKIAGTASDDSSYSGEKTIEVSGITLQPAEGQSINWGLYFGNGWNTNTYMNKWSINVNNCKFIDWQYAICLQGGTLSDSYTMAQNTLTITNSTFTNVFCAASVYAAAGTLNMKGSSFSASGPYYYAAQVFGSTEADSTSYNYYYSKLDDTEPKDIPITSDRYEEGFKGFDIVILGSDGKAKSYAGTITDAISNAAGNDTIVIPAGTYDIGNLSLTRPINFQGAGADKTILLGNVIYGNNTQYVNGELNKINWSGITLSPGSHSNHQGLCWSTGVVGNELNVDSCKFDGWQYAIGVNSNANGNTLNVTDTTFTNTWCAMSVKLTESEDEEKASNQIGKLDGTTTTDGCFAVQVFGTYKNTGINGYYYSTESFIADLGKFDNPDVKDITAPTGWEAKMGDTYGSLKALIEGASSSDVPVTIELLSDVALAETLVIDSQITLNGNGHTISYSGSATASNPASGALITVQGNDADDVKIQNITIDTDGCVKHGVQFYRVSGGKLEDVTVNGGAYTSVIVNGSKVTLENCVLNPDSSAYANIEYAMGVDVNDIPEITLSNVTGHAGIPFVYADKATADSFKSSNESISSDAEPKDIADAINKNYLNGAEITLVYSSEGSEPITIIGTQIFTITLDVNTGNAPADTTVTTNNEGKLSYLPTVTKDGQYVLAGWYTELNGGDRITTDTVFTKNTTIYAHWSYTGGSYISGPANYTVSVTAYNNGSVTVTPTTATAGATVTVTVTPNTGYFVNGVTVKDTDGKTINVTQINDTQYTFIMPQSNVTVSVDFSDVSPLPFTDVPAAAWYYDAVQYAYDNKLMDGIGDNLFAPNSTLTRGMMVTVLWRLENSPVTDYIIAFEDVPSNSWYADAVRWAASAGIVTGISDTNYAPDSYITREQLATMLCRYATYKGYSTTADATALQVFDDYENISPYAADALAWTVSTNLINGMGDNTLLPQGNATRAQTAAVLMRFVENISK